MSLKDWEKKVLAAPGAAERITDIEDELRLAVGLTALREQAGLSQRELAERIGVKQPRVAAIERARNITIDVLERYVDALGGQLQISVVKDDRTIPLIGTTDPPAKPEPRRRTPRPPREPPPPQPEERRSPPEPTPRPQLLRAAQTGNHLGINSRKLAGRERTPWTMSAC
jgi:transcriptional regulator with XRE-family HTH domain